jgi:hypothetical protein
MKKVKVKKAELLEILQNNRDVHKDVYEKAVSVYREEAIDKLKKMLKAAKDGGKIEHGLDMVEPVHHLDDYDRAIQMLEMSVDDVVELEQIEFANYVQDKWVWGDVWKASTMSYAAKFRQN